MNSTLQRRRVLLTAWLPTICYFVLIWTISSMSAPEFPTQLFPWKDKGVHFVEYAVMGAFVAHGFRASVPYASRLRIVVASVFACFAFGILDEIHQAFVPNRSADVLDVLADTAGGLIGSLLWVLASPIIFKSTKQVRE